MSRLRIRVPGLAWRRPPGRHRQQDDGPFAARLRAALHDAADVIEPGPDGLARIMARTRPGDAVTARYCTCLPEQFARDSKAACGPGEA